MKVPLKFHNLIFRSPSAKCIPSGTKKRAPWLLSDPVRPSPWTIIILFPIKIPGRLQLFVLFRTHYVDSPPSGRVAKRDNAGDEDFRRLCDSRRHEGWTQTIRTPFLRQTTRTPTLLIDWLNDWCALLATFSSFFLKTILLAEFNFLSYWGLVLCTWVG